MIACACALAGLMTLAAVPAAADFLQREVTVEGVVHRYALYVPPGYDPARRWPCVVFLHGSGECGTDGVKQTQVGLPPAILAHPDRWPCLVVMPQKPTEAEEWEEDEALVLAALAATTREFNVDPERVSLTGMSQGGHGVWYIAAHRPETFACLVPVCGYGRARTVAPRVAELPVWAFHGLKDDQVDPQDTRRIIEAIRAERGERGLDSESARMTLYPKLNHGCWDAAYGDPELPKWILAQTRRP